MLGKFEKIVLNIKNNVNKRYFGVFLYFCFCVILIFFMQVTKGFKSYKQQVEDKYNKAMYETVGYLKDIEVELDKLEISNSKEYKIKSYFSLCSKSSIINQNIESLPISDNVSTNIIKFFSQLSDLSYCLMEKELYNKNINENEINAISSTKENVFKLNNILTKIYNDLNENKIKWNKLEKISNEVFDSNNLNIPNSNINDVINCFKTYEGLLYDGAFSDHILQIKPQILQKEIVDKNKAKEYIKEIVVNKYKKEIEKLEFVETIDGTIKLYKFYLKIKGEEYNRKIYITQNDCKLYLMLSNKNTKKKISSHDMAIKKAKDFLNNMEISNMCTTYYVESENMITINFASCVNDVLIYPDLIKVKVSLDNLDIVMFEAKGYIYNNHKRDNLNPKFTIKDAKKSLKENMIILKERLTVIPTSDKKEVSAYEFLVEYNNKKYLIYINSDNLKEEKIYLVINNENGTLTI